MSPSAASFRPIGFARVGNGVVGSALVAIALAPLGPLLARASAAADSAGESLTAAAQALDQTATAFEGFGKSLDDAKASSADAARLLHDASTTSGQLADAMAINFLGAQPFLPISQSFRRNTDELRGVSEDLSTLSGAIGNNARDVGAVRDSVRVLRDRVRRIAGDAAASPRAGRVGPQLGLLAYGLTLWLGVLSAVSLATGWRLLR